MRVCLCVFVCDLHVLYVCVCREGVLVLISMYSAVSLILFRELRYIKFSIIIMYIFTVSVSV